MATPQEKLATSLVALGELQQDGCRVFRSRQFTRTDRERLLKHGFLQRVLKGWLVSTSPEASPGDTTPWFSSFWEFCRGYCSARFKEEWHLSPQQSLDLHAEKPAIPSQLVVYSPKGQNNLIELPFKTSIYLLKQKKMPPPADLMTRDGLHLFRPEAALLRISEHYYAQSPTEASVILRSIRDPSDLLERLLLGGHATIAGRLAGAFRRLGRVEIADDIVAAMRSADFEIRPSDPFEEGVEPSSKVGFLIPSPIVGRLGQLWASTRETVLRDFPPPPNPPPDLHAYLETVDDIYAHDAYHSLSIEGYQVTPHLIARVASGAWDPDNNIAHRHDKDALAARGYYQAFTLVRQTAARFYRTGESGFLRSDHRVWYRELFAPHVAAGLLDPSILAGYRKHPVFLRGSKHIPPRWEILSEAMPALLDLLEAEPDDAVRAILGHWLIGYLHPFPDGNGRVARFAMNALLAAGGYPWTVICVEERARYLHALEEASGKQDLRPFVSFVASQMRASELLFPSSRLQGNED